MGNRCYPAYVLDINSLTYINAFQTGYESVMVQAASFYVMKEARAGTPEDLACGTTALEVENSSRGTAPRCPLCNRFVGLLTWLPPYRVELETWGDSYGDIMLVGGRDLIVSARFRDIYETHNLKGLLFEPAAIEKVVRHRKINEPLPTFFKCTVPRTDALIDQQASGFEWDDDTPVCAQCLWKEAGELKSYQSIVVAQDTWMGEDAFHPRGCPVNVLVSSRFRRICNDYGIRSVVFFSADEYSWTRSLSRGA